jgi:hypothetical protein
MGALGSWELPQPTLTHGASSCCLSSDRSSCPLPCPVPCGQSGGTSKAFVTTSSSVTLSRNNDLHNLTGAAVARWAGGVGGYPRPGTCSLVISCL